MLTRRLKVAAVASCLIFWTIAFLIVSPIGFACGVAYLLGVAAWERTRKV